MTETSGVSPTLVVGVGITGRAVVDALLARGTPHLILVDDRPNDSVRQFAIDRGLSLVEAPGDGQIAELLVGAGMVIPAPGLPDRHPLMIAAREREVPVRSEFDLAAGWDARPTVAVTGTDGKTTVTTMVALMLDASGIAAALAGNNDVPLVSAIDDPGPEVFVVEASSFRLGHSNRFAPHVATWLNFAPDHLDVHADLAAYEDAKASIFDHQPGHGTAITNADDEVVTRHRLRGTAQRRLTFSADAGDYRVADGHLVTDLGQQLVAVADLPRRAPHDIANGLAAAATAIAAGATVPGVAQVLRTFTGLPHRTQLVAEHEGIRYVDDSKATVPHAVAAAVSGCDRAVLIAGGRNKGLDLTVLREVAPRLRAVVAIGESAGLVREVFEPVGVPVVDGESMDDAVRRARDAAVAGDTVLLSPGCASHDWYTNFAERGDDFARIVRSLITGTGPT